MGWNQGYTIMEKTVIELYNTSNLTKELLDVIMEPYKETDCDSGGSHDLKAKDGKGVREVICYVMEPEKYADAIEKPEYYPDEEEYWDSNKKAYELFESIWRDRWGIW